MDPLDAARRDAVVRLCRAQADGLLSIELFEERYALIRDAVSVAAVQAIVADLEGVSGGYAVAPLDDAAEVAGPPALPSLRLPAIFSSTKRAGDWTVPEVVDLLVILGEVSLDFCQATFAADTVIVNLSLTAGSLKVIVPAGTQVENECREILSSSKHSLPRRNRRATESNGILIVIRGFMVMGDLSIKEKPVNDERTLIDRVIGR